MKILVIAGSLLGLGIGAILERQVDWQIRRETTQDPEAIAELCQSYKPQVTVLDAFSLNVLELLQQLDRPRIGLLGRIIVVTLKAIDEETLFFLAKWRTSACIRTSTTPEDLILTVQRVGNDEWLLTSDILDTALQSTAHPLKKRENISRVPARASLQEIGELELALDSPLSPLEEEILSLIAQGKENRQIACELNLTQTATVCRYIRGIFAKLGVDNRTSAVVCALRRRWIRMPECPAPACTAEVA